MIGKDELYQEAILYRVSDDLSVVPSVSSLKKDPKSKNFFLLAKPNTLNCAPKKTYQVYDKSRFRPIRYEDNISSVEDKASYHDVFSLYDLSECLLPKTVSMENRSIIDIGRNYAIRSAAMTSPARIHFHTGLDYLKANYLDEAIYEFKQTINENPNLTQARNNLAFALIQKKRQNEALPHLEIAEKLAKGILETQNLFGLAYTFNGQVDKAIDYFELATRIDPSHPTAYRYLFQIYTNIKKDSGKAGLYLDKLNQMDRK